MHHLPEYVEMFPLLEMGEVQDRPYRTRWVTWLTNGQEKVGSCEVRWQDTAIELEYVIRKLPEHLAGWDSHVPDVGRRILPINPVARGSHSFRFHVICRAYGKYVYRLLFRTADWLCQRCQSVRNRSTYVTASRRHQEEYDLLRLEVSEGRPFGMREQTYARKRMRMQELLPRLDGTRRRPGPEFDFMVYAQWHDRDPEA